MGTTEMLQRALAYEEALLRNYQTYAAQASSTEVGTLFQELAQEKAAQIQRLKSMFKRYCKT